MPNLFAILAFGFFLGMRHATDADHVIAVTTIVTRKRDLLTAALTGFFWGIGHTLTIVAVGTAIILFNVTIPHRVGLGMEFSVALMLIALGVLNVIGFVRTGHAAWLPVKRSRDFVPALPHSHGDYVHSHPAGHAPGSHPHRLDQTPLAALDRWFGTLRLYGHVRPVVVGVVHGLAGSAAVTLIVLAAIRDPWWAMAYLLVFGFGTVAGMILITMGIASAFRAVSRQSSVLGRRLGLASGLLSVGFGLVLAYQICLEAAIP
jgi:high-affinity nickel-transport protein